MPLIKVRMTVQDKYISIDRKVEKELDDDLKKAREEEAKERRAN
jgi:hypothetical protein